MKKTLLVNAPFLTDSTYSIAFYGQTYPNPGLAGLAGFLETKNIPADVLDAKFQKLDFDETLDRIKKFNPELIGFTSMTTEIQDVHSLIKETKKALPGVVTVLGGVHASALPQETIESNESLDVAAVGEGEWILHDLINGKSFPEIGSICYRENGEIKSTDATRKFEKSLDGYGPMAFHHWPNAALYRVPSYRGCPFKCSFCFKVLGSRIRLRNMDDVITDIEYVAANKGAMDFTDATFALNRKHAETMLNEMISRGLQLPWKCTTRVDVVDPEILKMMKDAGCASVAFGIESGSDRILNHTGKGITVEKIKDSVDKAKAAGLETVGYYVFGHPDETKEEVLQTVDMIWKLNTHMTVIGIMVPWPGTEVFKLAEKNEGGYKLLHRNYAAYDKHYGVALEYDNFSMEWLEKTRIKSYLNLYLRNRRYGDFIKFLYERRKNIWKKFFVILGRLFGK